MPGAYVLDLLLVRGSDPQRVRLHTMNTRLCFSQFILESIFMLAPE
jgi:hypothetical protein